MEQNHQEKMASLAKPEVLSRARERLALIESTVCYDIRFAHFGGLMKDVEKTLHHISKAELKENDVISCGYMRSGNHWVFEILCMALSQKAQFTKEQMKDHFLEFMGDKVDETLEAMLEPRLLATHLQPQWLPKDVVRKRVKVVYILRNPKDMLVSWFGVMTKYKQDTLRFQGTWDEFFELQLTGEFLWGSWFDHVLACEKFTQDHPDVPVYVIQFEKLREQPVDVIAELCRFLGQPDTLSEQIAAATSLETMQAQTVEKSKALSDKFLTEQMMVAAKGLVKAWKTRFTVDQNERFDKAFEERMARSQLGDRLRKYIY